MDNYSGGIQVFDHDKHFILSSELKKLYVAVTRARQRLWIYDDNEEFRKPIQLYWKDLVRVVQSLEDIRSSSYADRAESCELHEWDQRGKNFMEQRNYAQVRFI